LTPPAPEDFVPEVNVVTASPRTRPPAVVVEVYAITGETVSPPPVGLIIVKTTGAPPTGKPFESRTDAVSVEMPLVVEVLFATSAGDGCIVIEFADETGAVIVTVRLSLLAELARSVTVILATPPCVVVSVAVAVGGDPLTGTDTTALAPPFQTPTVVANSTAEVGAGAKTSTASESPMFIGVRVLLAITVPFNVCLSMEKVAADGETVRVAVEVAPNAAAVTVTVPASVPVATTLTLPDAFVVHGAANVHGGASVAVPLPPMVKVTVVFGTATLAESFALMVSVWVVEPSSGSVAAGGFTATVEPTICTAIWALMLPAAAVMVATRLALVKVPEVKVRVALPVASVVTDPVERLPVFALNPTVVEGTTALEASTAVTVIVVWLTPSELIVVGAADNCRVATVDAAAPLAVLELPLQAASRASIVAIRNDIEYPAIL
jgi:hypothetical protein